MATSESKTDDPLTKESSVIVLTGECEEVVEDPAFTHPYKRDPFQQHAFVQISRHKNILVTAHTSCGKTTPAIDAIAHLIRASKLAGRDDVVLYTSPIKALSNQKYQEFKEIFAQYKIETGIDIQVGLLTGDNQINPTGDIIIITTEILMNSLRMSPEDKKVGHVREDKNLSSEIIQRVKGVIFDEIHFFNDPERGSVWETCLVLLPPEVQLIMLSATIDEADKFAGWIGRIKGEPTYLIPTKKRVIPLKHYLYLKDSGHHLICDSDEKFKAPEYHERKREFQEWLKHKKNPYPPHTSQLISCVKYLKQRNLIPVIFFVFNCAQCGEFAQLVRENLLTPEESSQVDVMFHKELGPHREKLESLPQYHQMYELLRRGIAYHHSDVCQLLRELIEKLFKHRLVKVLFATETFAVGVNMPTRTVVFTSLEKHDGKGRRILRPDEYKQMGGRAGRRGKDVEGTVLILPLYGLPDPHEMKGLFEGKVPSLRSQFKINYSFVLKIAASKDFTLERFLTGSLFQQEQDLIRKRIQADLEAGEQKFLEEEEKYRLWINEQEPGLEKEHEKMYRLREGPAEDFGGLRVSQKVNKKDRDFLNRHQKDEEWMLGYERYLSKASLKKDLQRQSQELKGMVDHQKEQLRAFCYILSVMGYLRSEHPEDLEREDMITKKGLMAVNSDKVNGILLVEMLTRGLFHELEASQIVAILAMFIGVGKKGTEMPVSDLVAPVADYVHWVYDIREECWGVEEEALPAGSMASYWELSLGFVDAAYLWAEGKSIQECLAYLDSQGGSFIKNMIRLNDLVQDLIQLCQIQGDQSLIPKLNGLEEKLIRDQVSVSSLYL